MDILQLETFLEIVNTKSISEASRRLFISQPTASHRLNTLEEELGFPLIERGKGVRKIRLTPFGEKFIPVAYKWSDLWKDLQYQMNSQYKLPLAIGCTESMNIHVFAPFYKELQRGQRGHAFDLMIRTERSTEIHRMIENRDLDVGFVYSLHPNTNILITPLFAEQMLVLRLDESGAGAEREQYHPSELDTKYEIYTNWSGDFQMWHQNYWNYASPFVTLDSEYLIIDYLDSPELWAIVPDSVARVFVQRNPLIRAYPLAENPPKRVYYKITHRVPRENRLNSLQIFSGLLAEFIFCHEDISSL